jgi:hypothetical protein
MKARVRKITGRGRQAQANLHRLDPSVPKTEEFIALLSQICAVAMVKHKQDEDLCNYAWASGLPFGDARKVTRAELLAMGEELTAAWVGSKVCLQNDPRGFVVRIEVPNGNGEAWAGGLGIA